MQEIVLTLGLLIFVVWWIANSLLKNESERYQVQLKLIGVLAYNLIFFLFWPLIFIVKEFNKAETYAPVLDTIFTIYSTVITVGNWIVFLVVGILLCYMMFVPLFRRKK